MCLPAALCDRNKIHSTGPYRMGLHAGAGGTGAAVDGLSAANCEKLGLLPQGKSAVAHRVLLARKNVVAVVPDSW